MSLLFCLSFDPAKEEASERRKNRKACVKGLGFKVVHTVHATDRNAPSASVPHFCWRLAARILEKDQGEKGESLRFPVPQAERPASTQHLLLLLLLLLLLPLQFWER